MEEAISLNACFIATRILAFINPDAFIFDLNETSATNTRDLHS